MSNPTDTELLDWLIFYCGRVCTSKDGDDAWVVWYSDDEELKTPILSDSRDAIVKAMEMEKELNG